ncbi:MAG: phosphodiester glycosidase family protein [Clostridia bacterium]|nr:phosphodiester glycosidase family protein [Clostridia bacterium]
MFTAWKRMLIIALLCVCCVSACAETLEPLDMDSFDCGPAPRDEAYTFSDPDDQDGSDSLKQYYKKYSDKNAEVKGFDLCTGYEDESISVKLYHGTYGKTDYVYAHVKISDPSQLRTASANGPFTNNSNATAKGSKMAANVNAVLAINGDYYTKPDKCQVVMRQGKQVRNRADGTKDLLVIDRQGNFTALPESPRDAGSYALDPQRNYYVSPGCTAAKYKEYLQEHQNEMYQVFCFGPVLVQNGVSVISEDYRNGYVGSHNLAQRTAIAQLGPLEYMVIACNGPQSSPKGDMGLTLYEFASICETAGKQLSENGCLLAYNMDGGNSAQMIFKALDTKKGALRYVKVSSPDIGERQLSDILYFATLVK